ncbi:MAG TPA: hypothetical protein VFP01_07905 [Propionibacteriaceae bacterium]|nr:hypothetical protein [Propionibacteriaceae bacterium]
MALVESAWGAVPGLLLVRFPRPLAEPAVPVSRQRALHGVCHSGVVEHCPGVGDLAAAVSVSDNRHRCHVEQFDPVRRRSGPPAVAAGEVAADVFPFPAAQSRMARPITPRRSVSAGRIPSAVTSLLWVRKSRVRPVFTRIIRVPLIEGTGELVTRD